ncbi:MAG: HD domain-containing phosphohydrolase [Planctomycetota bacterium]|jgi:HD-GYP domain-containing protein (c-di-GMP phosphodiesterase class II)
MSRSASIAARYGGVALPSLRDLGIVLMQCDAAANPTCRPSRGAHWLTDLCAHCPMIWNALREAWAEDPDPSPRELLPGLWVCPLANSASRPRASYDVAVVLTRSLLESGHLAAMCQSAELDETITRRGLVGLPLASPDGIDHLLAATRHLQLERRSIADVSHALEAMGQELAASYEEINLLYGTIESMSVVEDPFRFISIACEELLQTLSYRWIGAFFDAGHPWLKVLAGRFVIAGKPSSSAEQLERLSEMLLDRASAGKPMVIEPDHDPDHEAFAELGRAVLVQPVRRNRQVIGVLVAADKHGTDVSASSVDLKLLGATATHLAIFLENASLYDDLSATFMGTLEGLTAAIDAKDRYTCGHSLRVAHLTRQLATAVGIDAATADRMHIAGLVHDVGKIGVPEAVLTKPGRLTDEEFAAIQKHPEIGHRILKDIPQLKDILPGVLYHHERWDGEGYPQRLAGEDIPRIARVISLADAFDAMSSTRTYRPSLSRDRVLREIREQAGRQFDPRLAAFFVQLDFTEFDELVRSHSAGLTFTTPDAA